MKYDLIGDIHGHSRPLLELLSELGYRQVDGVYRHSERQVIFLGDFIDRGPDQRGVLEIVRPMIDQGAALSVMGNHEFNAIAYFTLDPDDHSRHLREHSAKHRGQHEAFLQEYEGTGDYAEVIEWFRTLPLWLDLPGVRIVHACWDNKMIEFLQGRYPTVNQYLDDELLVCASSKGSKEFEAVETLLKGKEIELPGGQSFPDKDGNLRHHIRIKWWDETAATYLDTFLGPDAALTHIPDDPIDTDHLLQYSHEDPPVFIGHYWMDTEPKILAPNVACLDYSVASKSGGKLVAYQWNGEQELKNENLVFVESRAPHS